MVIIFKSELTIESVIKQIEKMESIEKVQGKEYTMYFSSVGGDLVAKELLLDYLKANPYWTIVGFDEIDSCAFTLFAECPNNKYILKETQSIVHQYAAHINSRELKKNDLYVKKASKELENSNQDLYLLLHNLEVKPNLIEEIKNGEDIPLVYEDLKKLNWNYDKD